jgi:hypothetical protein
MRSDERAPGLRAGALPVPRAAPSIRRAPIAPRALVGLALALSAAAPAGAQAPNGPSAGARVRVETAAGTLEGLTSGLRYSGESGIWTLDDKRFPIEEAIILEFAGEDLRAAPALVFLDSGEELAVEIKDGPETHLSFTCAIFKPGGDAASPGGGPSANGASSRIEIERVRALALPSQFPSPVQFQRFRQRVAGGRQRPIPVQDGGAAAAAAAAPKEAGPAAGSSDVLYTPDGSTLEGLITRVDDRGVGFESATLGSVQLPYSKLRAATLGLVGGAAPAPRPAGLRVGATGRDGSYLEGKLLGVGDGVATLESSAAGPVRMPVEQIRSLEVLGGRILALSTLEPAGVRHRPSLFSPYPVQRDANVLGGPLRIRGQTFRSGLGMLSHCRLDYRLDDRFARFQAVIGIDDEARPQSLEAEARGGGIAIFRVYLDDRTVLQKELSYRDPPLPIDLSLEGIKTLGIEVDYGQGFLVLDFADWANARLVRKS